MTRTDVSRLPTTSFRADGGEWETQSLDEDVAGTSAERSVGREEGAETASTMHSDESDGSDAHTTFELPMFTPHQGAVIIIAITVVVAIVLMQNDLADHRLFSAFAFAPLNMAIVCALLVWIPFSSASLSLVCKLLLLGYVAVCSECSCSLSSVLTTAQWVIVHVAGLSVVMPYASFVVTIVTTPLIETFWTYSAMVFAFECLSSGAELRSHVGFLCGKRLSTVTEEMEQKQAEALLGHDHDDSDEVSSTESTVTLRSGSPRNDVALSAPLRMASLQCALTYAIGVSFCFTFAHMMSALYISGDSSAPGAQLVPGGWQRGVSTLLLCSFELMFRAGCYAHMAFYVADTFYAKLARTDMSCTGTMVQTFRSPLFQTLSNYMIETITPLVFVQAMFWSVAFRMPGLLSHVEFDATRLCPMFNYLDDSGKGFIVASLLSGSFGLIGVLWVVCLALFSLRRDPANWLCTIPIDEEQLLVPPVSLAVPADSSARSSRSGSIDIQLDASE